MMKRGDVGGDVFALIIVGRETFVARAGEVDDLEWLALQCRQRADDRLIDAGRALASAHDEERAQIFVQSEFPPGSRAIDLFEFGADRACR